MNETNATETNAGSIAPQEKSELEIRLAKLEEEKENYRKAYLKEAQKGSKVSDEETEDEKTRRIIQEEDAKKRLAELDKETNETVQKLIKENKELKLAQANKTVPSAVVTSTESSSGVRDGLVTPEQEKYFREGLKWSDKDIERYKKNTAKRI